MKKIHAFFLTVAGAAMLLPLMAADCAGGPDFVNCTSDAQCQEGETCLTITDNSACTATDETECSCVADAGEGEGEGVGEGEGAEGEGASECNDLELGVGDDASGIVATSAELVDGGELCFGDGTCDQISADLSCFDLEVDLDSTTIGEGDISGSWIKFNADGGDDAVFALEFCNGGDVGCSDDGVGDIVCFCGLCLSAPPDNLAVAVNDGTDDSNGVCVTLP